MYIYYYIIFMYEIYLSSIAVYSVASTKETAFVIGGSNAVSDDDRDPDFITQFKNDVWSFYGNLQKGRSWHGSISIGSKTMVIGGYTPDSDP